MVEISDIESSSIATYINNCNGISLSWHSNLLCIFLPNEWDFEFSNYHSSTSISRYRYRRIPECCIKLGYNLGKNANDMLQKFSNFPQPKDGRQGIHVHWSSNQSSPLEWFLKHFISNSIGVCHGLHSRVHYIANLTSLDDSIWFLNRL